MWTSRRIDEWGDYHSPNVCFGKSAGSPPQAPNAGQITAQQQTANQQSAEISSMLDNTSQYTPYGNLIYEPTSVDPGTGVPDAYKVTQTLNPLEQQALDSQQSLTASLYGLANNQEGRIQGAVSQPFNTSEFPALPTAFNASSVNLPSTSMSGIPAMPTNPSGVDTGAMNTVFGAQMSELQPQFAQQKTQLEDQMAQEGFEPGSQAWDNQEQMLMNSQGATEQQAAATGVQAGTALGAQEWNQQMGATQQGAALQNQGYSEGMGNAQEQAALQSQQFSQGTSANETGLQEEETLRELPLNEAIAMMSGTQIQNPTFTNTPNQTVAPTDVVGAYGVQSQAQQAQYAAQAGAASSGNSSAAGMLGTAAMAGATIF